MSLASALDALKERRIPPEAIALLALIQNDGIIYNIHDLHKITGFPTASVKDAMQAISQQGILVLPSGYLKQSLNTPDEQKTTDELILFFDREMYMRTGHPLERVWGRDRKMMKGIEANFGENVKVVMLDWMNWRSREKRPITIPLLYGNREIIHQKWKSSKHLIVRQRPVGVPVRVVPQVEIPLDLEAIQRVKTFLDRRRGIAPVPAVERSIEDL